MIRAGQEETFLGEVAHLFETEARSGRGVDRDDLREQAGLMRCQADALADISADAGEEIGWSAFNGPWGRTVCP